MKKIKYNIFLLSIFILLFLGSCGKKGSDPVSVSPPDVTEKVLSFIPKKAPSDNSVYFEKILINYPEITLDIKMKNCKNVFGAAMEITYDSSKIKYVFSNRGDVLGAGNNTIFSAKLYKEQEGTLIVGAYKEGNAPGAEGDGTLATIGFYVINAEAEANIEFNAANCSLKSSLLGNTDIPNTSWIGGSLIYQ